MGRLWLLLLLIGVYVQAQVRTTGYVKDAISGEPLEGVSVFYDGTTLGTVTNAEGYFSITVPKSLTTPLIISFIGFETQSRMISDSGSLDTIHLKESAVELDEVVLKPDTWSRKKKLNIFRREFLGKTMAALQCRIRNEDDIRLYYNSEAQILYAYAKVPIRISNAYLGYDITYGLHDFEVRFSIGSSGLEWVDSSYSAGTVLFTEKREKVKRKHQKNRESTYLGSVLHFMRALAGKKLAKEKFKIFYKRNQVEPYDFFEMEMTKRLTKVSQTTEQLSLLYDGREQSTLNVLDSVFFIDEYGNHTPVQNVYFGGSMGRFRAGNMLPLDYVPNTKK